VGNPSFGVELHQYLDARTVLEEARLAERLGYASVWFGDSQLIWRELYGLLGAAAATTSRIKLGTGVTNPVTRHPAVTASAIATVQELSGGRAILGISVGDTALKSMGLGPASRAELTRYVQMVRSLGLGDTVQGPSGEMRLAYATATTPAPIVIGASGPKMLHLAGQIGDGVVITREARAGPTLTAMLRCVAEGRASAGRVDGPFMTCVSASVAVHEDRSKALLAVRSHVASTLRHVRWELSEPARRASEALNAVYNVSEHMIPQAQHAELIPEEVIPEYAIAGRPEECIAQARGLFDAGVDEITIRPYGVDGGSRAATIEAFARLVMTPLLNR
jgi:5,10-methylenetetrahydromethanopterin reductase